MAGTGNWGWVFARPVTAGTGDNGLNMEQFYKRQGHATSKHIFTPNGGYCVDYPATCTVLKLREYSWIVPSFSWGVFGQMMYLDHCVLAKIFDGLYLNYSDL